MKRDELRINVARTNGRPQRLVIVEHLTRGEYRDNLDPNSATSRARFIAGAGKQFGADPTALEWMNQALVEAADAADRRADEAAGEGDDGERKSTADVLVELALAQYRIGRTDGGDEFAVEHAGPNLAIMFRGSRDALRSTLARRFRELSGRTPNSSALTDALTVLAGEAYAAAPEPVHLRVAEHDGNIVIDLGDLAGRAIVVQPGEWKVVERSPVVFRRTAATGTLPVPERGGDLAELQSILNVSSETWPLVLGWLVAALLPNIPHPILLLGGQQGTGKSTAAEQLVGLVDPSPAVLRSPPRDSETWAISAAASWVVGVDNVSTIPDWWSDSLCKAVTGDGWLRRKLYTDGELAVLSFRRVVLLTSIDPGALRGDLGDRVLLVDLEPIEHSARLTQRGIEDRYRAARPRLFGALLDLLGRVWRKLPSVDLEQLPRMADFAQLLAAMDCVRGDGRALDIYMGQRERIAETVIEGDAVALAIQAMLDIEPCWEGTVGELLNRLTPDKPPKGWPRTPQGMGGKLRRLTPALQQVGIAVAFGWTGRGNQKRRCVMIGREEPQTNGPIVPNVPDANPYGETAGTTGDDGDDLFPEPSSEWHTAPDNGQPF